MPGTKGVRRTQANAVSYQSKPGLGTEGDNSSKWDLRDQLTDRFLNRVTGTINKGFNPDGPQDQMEGFPTQDPMTWDLHIISVGNASIKIDRDHPPEITPSRLKSRRKTCS